MANKLPLDPFGNVGAANVVSEGMTERVERHALIGNATGVSQIVSEPLAPLVGKVPVGSGSEQMEQPIAFLILHGLSERDKPLKL